MYITSPVDVCNMALDYLRQDSINSIESPTNENERILARWYDITRQGLLRDKVWNFAVKRTILTASATTPIWGYQYEYNLPNDFLRFVSLGTNENYGSLYNVYARNGDNSSQDYELENNKLLVNNFFSNTSTDLYLRYIHDITSVGSFDRLFVDLLAIKIAVNVFYKFNASANEREALYKLYLETERKARAIDSQERPTRRVQRSKFLNAGRNRGSGEAGYIAF